MSEEKVPASVQQMLGADGEPPRIKFRGNTFKVGFPTQQAKARLEELVGDVALSRIEAKEGKVKPSTYAKMLEKVTDDVAANAYATWTKAWHQIVWADNGALFLLSLLQEHHPDTTIAQARALVMGCGNQVKVAMAKVLPLFLEVLLRSLEDKTPEQEAQFRTEFANFVDAMGLSTPAPSPSEPTPPDTAN